MKIFKISLTILFFSLSVQLFAQYARINGYVLDTESKEPIIGANIYITGTMQGTTSNNFGYYSLSIPKGKNLVQVSFVGYTTKQLTIDLANDTSCNFMLLPGQNIEEVTIVGHHAERDIAKPATITVRQMRLLPNLTGEADVLKAFQYLPGIAQGGEGNNDLYVRGGSPDQNLVLLDDVPLYYVNHIGGLVSIFDDYSVSDISVYKSGFPARYGGRLSSVIDVRMKNGRMDKLGGEISVGLISSKLSLEGPLFNKRASFMFSARKSMTDLYMRPISYYSMFNNDGYMVYAFYDINGKINFNLSENDKLYLSFYNGSDNVKMSVGYSTGDDWSVYNEDDIFDFNNEATSGWGNTMGCARWNHIYNRKLFSNVTLALSKYYYENRSFNEIVINDTGLASETFNYNFQSGVFDRLAKIDFDYFPSNKHRVRFGAKANYHRFNTGRIEQLYHVNEEALPDSALRVDYRAEIDTSYGGEYINALEASAYVEDEIELTRYLSLNAGLHFAMYLYNGDNFSSLQPRLSLKLLLPGSISLRSSYVQMSQFIHMLTGSDTSMPADIWVPVTNYAKPEKSQQVSLGIEKSFDTGGIKLSTEVFYKTMHNLIDYKLGENLVSASEAWHDKIEVGGKGKVYGAEFLAEKTKGKLTGWLSYTYSKNTREFVNINNGNVYPYVYDRPHDLSLVVNYNLNDRVTFSGTWEYRSGRRLTLGMATYDANTLMNSKDLTSHRNYYSLYRRVLYEWDSEKAMIYGTKNNYKMDDYHKLCVNVHFNKQKKRGKRIITVGLNNVYNRKNAYNIYYNIKDDGIVDLNKLTLFPIMPSFSYSFKF